MGGITRSIERMTVRIIQQLPQGWQGRAFNALLGWHALLQNLTPKQRQAWNRRDVQLALSRMGFSSREGGPNPNVAIQCTDESGRPGRNWSIAPLRAPKALRQAMQKAEAQKHRRSDIPVVIGMSRHPGDDGEVLFIVKAKDRRDFARAVLEEKEAFTRLRQAHKTSEDRPPKTWEDLRDFQGATAPERFYFRTGRVDARSDTALICTKGSGKGKVLLQAVRIEHCDPHDPHSPEDLEEPGIQVEARVADAHRILGERNLWETGKMNLAQLGEWLQQKITGFESERGRPR